MEVKKEDRRIRLTKRMIREALFELMQEHSISNISVKMICERADINRSTFYSHYKNQYDLLESIQKGIISDIKKHVFSASFLNAPDSAVAVLVQILEYGRQNAALLKVLLSENGNSSFQNDVMRLAQEKITDELGETKVLSTQTVQYLQHFTVGGLLSIMRHWLEMECADEPESIAKLMMTLLVYGTNGLSPLE
jgi:Transcriptional regulator